MARTEPGRAASGAANEFYDSHFHLTNYIQQGITPRSSCRSWARASAARRCSASRCSSSGRTRNSGDFAPTYYLQSDAPLYYYSFTDAYIASVYKSLTPAEQARFDPMITGFNPADMYGVDHIRRVLQMFPGVFTGIGEFSIHKEFVSAKISGETASLTNPALDRMLDFAAESGLVVILHNDIDMPFAKVDAEPVYLTQIKDVLRRHPQRIDHLGAHRPGTYRAPGAGIGGNGRARSESHRRRRSDAHGPDARSRQLRHLVGRSGEVRGGVAAGDGARGDHAQPLSRSIPVRDRHRRAGRARRPISRCSTCGNRSGGS